MKTLLRILGIWSLLAAMIAFAIDATKSMAASEWVSTPLGEYWYKLHPASLNTLQAAIERHVHPYLWDPVVFTVLQAPAWVFFGVLGILLYLLGRPRRRIEVFSN